MQSGNYEPDFPDKHSRRSSRRPTRSSEHQPKPLPIVNDLDSPMPQSKQFLKDQRKKDSHEKGKKDNKGYSNSRRS